MLNIYLLFIISYWFIRVHEGNLHVQIASPDFREAVDVHVVSAYEHHYPMIKDAYLGRIDVRLSGADAKWETLASTPQIEKLDTQVEYLKFALGDRVDSFESYEPKNQIADVAHREEGDEASSDADNEAETLTVAVPGRKAGWNQKVIDELNEELGVDFSLEDWERFQPLSEDVDSDFLAPELPKDEAPDPNSRITSKSKCAHLFVSFSPFLLSHSLK
jgi:hypothetical protein